MFSGGSVRDDVLTARLNIRSSSVTRWNYYYTFTTFYISHVLFRFLFLWSVPHPIQIQQHFIIMINDIKWHIRSKQTMKCFMNHLLIVRLIHHEGWRRTITSCWWCIYPQMFGFFWFCSCKQTNKQTNKSVSSNFHQLTYEASVCFSWAINSNRNCLLLFLNVLWIHFSLMFSPNGDKLDDVSFSYLEEWLSARPGAYNS